MRHPPGTPVSVVMTKWGDRPHWEFEGRYLGSDEHGGWIGFPTGTRFARPGLEFDTEADSVTLVPAAGWMATCWAPGLWVEWFVDMTTPARWSEAGVTAVDLDLDVIRRRDGTVYLDDEDEFAAHRVAYGYPPEIVALAERSAAEVMAGVEAAEPPFDHTAQRWLDALGALPGR